MSRRWVITLVQRFLTDGEFGLVPRSRRQEVGAFVVADRVGSDADQLGEFGDLVAGVVAAAVVMAWAVDL